MAPAARDANGRAVPLRGEQQHRADDQREHAQHPADAVAPAARGQRGRADQRRRQQAPASGSSRLSAGMAVEYGAGPRRVAARAGGYAGACDPIAAIGNDLLPVEAAAVVELLHELLRRTHLSTPSDLGAIVADQAPCIGAARRGDLPDRLRARASSSPLARTLRAANPAVGRRNRRRARVQRPPAILRVAGEQPGQQRLWLPLLDGTERLGVMGMSFDGGRAFRPRSSRPASATRISSRSSSSPSRRSETPSRWRAAASR